ncbi:MAG: rRNA maturation RNase YbeY [Clostridia bacterium]|nr:rRNA maturation RNase YbeY [Clostridia bacterium]
MIKVYGGDENVEIFDRIATQTYQTLNLSGDGAVEVCFVSKQQIRDLNAQTRNIDKVTDVLSYPALDEIVGLTKENYPYEYDDEIGAVQIGSIVICSEVALEQANEYGHSVERENCYLFTHGLLHLLGYDHIEENDRAIMREKEEEILGKLGITRSE